MSSIHIGSHIRKYCRDTRHFLYRNKTFLLSLAALGLGIHNFWYIHIRSEQNLVATILSMQFAEERGGYSVELGFSNAGNKYSVIPNVTVYMQTEGEDAISPIKWNRKESIVLPPGELNVSTIVFGDSSAVKGAIRRNPDLKKTYVSLGFSVIDQKGDLHVINEPIGYAYVHYNNLFTVTLGSFPRKIPLLPTPVARPRQTQRGFFGLSDGPPISAVVYFDPATGDPRIRVIQWDKEPDKKKQTSSTHQKEDRR